MPFYRNTFLLGNRHLYDTNHARAVQMRHVPTEAESIVWELVRANRLGVKFRRQQLIGEYIVDFYCLSHKLVIEIDGSVHDNPTQQSHDRQRDAWMTKNGYTVLRFTNEQVFDDLDGVRSTILQYVSPKHQGPLAREE
mgnify:CR=1 FL=1